TVMSDSEDSTVTYTEVSSLFEGLSDIGSPGVVGPEDEGLPWMLDDPYMQVVLQASPSPNYVPGPEEPEQAPPLSDFVPEPVYPEFMPPEDEVFPAEEQPLPVAASPTADSPGYVPESNSKEDPVDGGDDGDDEDELSDDDEDDDVDIKEDEEEEEHPAPANSTAVALPTIDHAPSAKETEPFEIEKVARLLAIPTPPPSPLSLWSSPLPHIPSPPLPLILLPLPLSLPLPISYPSLPAGPTYLLGYRAAMIRLRAEAPSTSHLPPPHIILSHTRADTPPSGTPPLLPILLPTSSPPLHLLSIDRRANRPEVTLPPQKRADYGFDATIDREIMWDLERDVSYGIIDTWDEMLVDMPGAPATDDIELGRRMTEFSIRFRQDTVEIYTRLDDEQSER
ncbi:hypothetical protein Tco_0879556, partial [Tanacetum coccineum]